MNASSELSAGTGPASVVRALPPFIGRRPQLAWLERCLTETVAGRPHMALIAGDAGIGKTRLVKELRASALRAGAQVFYGRCYEDLNVPYLPLVEALHAQLSQVSDAGGDGEAEVMHRLLHHAAVAAPPASASAQTDQEKLRLFLAVSHAAIQLAQRQSTLLVLDDMHWADRSSLELLAHLVFAVADAAARASVPLMIIGTYRPVQPEEPLAHVLARLEREDICQTLELAGLDEPGVDELVRSLGVTNPAHQLVATISAATGGNPLFVEEVLHHLVKQGALAQRGGHLVTTIAPTDLRLPAQVTGAIAARLDGLSEPCRSALILAAFLGDAFTPHTLGVLSGQGEDALLGLLDEAVRQRLVTSEGAAFQFAHPLIRHVFYNRPTAARRQRIHLDIAQTLERLHAVSLDEHVMDIAHHCIAAGAAADAEKVVTYAQRAGDQAYAVFAWGEAAHYYAAAAAAAESAPRSAAHERAALHHRAAVAHLRDRDVGPCLDHYERAIPAYQASGDVRGWAQALREKTHAYFTLASVPYGTLIDVQPLEDALQALGDQDPGLSGRIWATMAHVYWTARQLDKAQAMAQRALEIGQRIDDHRLCVDASVALAMAQMQSLHLHEGLESYESALRSSRQIDDPWLQSWPLQRMPLALIALGRLDDAEAVAREAGELARKTHDWAEHSLGLASLVGIAVARGDFDAAERHAHEAMLLVRRSRYPWGGPLFLPALACARLLRGAATEAEDAIDILVEPGCIFEEAGPALQFMAWMFRQLIRAQSGAADEVREHFGASRMGPRAAERGDLNALAAFCAVTEISDLLDAPALAEPAYQVLSAAAERGVVFTSGWVFLIPRILGVTATVNRRWEQAEVHFDAAIEAATRARARPELGRSCLDYARMLAARNGAGDRQRAVALVGQAAAIFDALGMELFTPRAAQLADALQADLPPPRQPPDRARDLSGRELDVLRSIARGRSSRQIADELVISPATAAQHASTVFTKIGVAGPTAASAYAVQQGLVAATDTQPRTRAASGETPLVILFTDMEGSTALIQRVGDAAARQVMHTHNQILRSCLRRHRGAEIQHTGDGLMASFASAAAAINSAVAMQRALAAHNQRHSDTPIRVRIGLNAGEPMAEEERLFGAAVNAAARICARARAGTILVSDVVRQLTAGKGIVFTDRGRVALKGFAERLHLYEVQWENVTRSN